MENNKGIIDVDDFLERVQNDKELLLELLDIFANDFPKKQKELAQAIEQENCDGVHRTAHFLKGSCGNISCKALWDIFYQLEEMGRMGNLAGAKEIFAQVDQGFQEVLIRSAELKKQL